MQKTIEYPVKTVFPSKKNLEYHIKRHNPQEDGTILLCGSNIDGYEARYDPNKNRIILRLQGATEEDLVEANLKFFRFVDNYFKIN